MSTRKSREKVRKARQHIANSAHLNDCFREADRLAVEMRRKRDANRQRYEEVYTTHLAKKRREG